MFRRTLKALIPNQILVAGRLATKRELAEIPFVTVPAVAEIMHHIVNTYGYGLALIKSMPVDANGFPIPWYTYPMIEYLSSFDFSQARVFEYGCGNSSLWWSSQAREIISVEDNPEWHSTMSKQVPSNATIILEKDPIRYAETISKFGTFDLIIVDGEIARYQSCVQAVKYLKPGGAIILDNSDCLPKCTEFLRNSDLFEVAMNGFSPLISRASRTSLFLSQPCKFRFGSHKTALAGTDERWSNLDTPL